MRLNHVHLRNFRQHVDTRLQFDSGLTGIIGPNGAGKSTILEAIAWALYGMAAARGTKEGIRSLRASGRAAVRVELDFDLAGHRYLVSRSLTSAELYLDGSSTPIANTISGVSDLIRRRLGMSQQEFFNTYFTGQKELSVMAAMGPAERAQFLSRVLGYERLRGAQALVRERRNLIRGEATGLQSAMPESDAVARQLNEADVRVAQAQTRAKTALRRLSRAVKALTELKPRWQEAQREREVLQQVAAERAVRESEETAFARDVQRLGQELEEIVEARKEIAQISAELHVHSDLAAQLVEMDRLAREEGRRRQLKQDKELLEDELTRLRERAAAGETAAQQKTDAEQRREATRTELDAVAKRLEGARTEWVRDKQEAETKHEARQSHYKEVKQQRNQITDLGPESPCPICTRPLADHFREVMDDLDGKLTEIEVEGRYYASRVEQLREMPDLVRELDERARLLMEREERETTELTDLSLRVEEYRRLRADIAEREAKLATTTTDLDAIPPGYHVTRHAELRHRHAQFSEMVAKSQRLGALTEREPQLQKQLKGAQGKLEKSRARVNELKQRQSSSKFSETKFVALKQQYETLEAEHRAAQLDGLGSEKELEAAREVRETAENNRLELERAQERLRVLTMDRRLHDELDRAFTDIRAELNQHLRPEISDLASGFLSDLTDGRYGELELDDDYNIIVLEDDIPKPVISGGEEDLANLVLRLAISQMIAERAGQAFSLLVLDEVFGSLDEARRHNVVELLRRLHDRFEQVIVITHIESVREGLDRVVSVRYDAEAGISRVEQEPIADVETREVNSTEYAAAGAGD